MESTEKMGGTSALQEIGFLELKNQGGFVVRLECYYTTSDYAAEWKTTGNTGDITLGRSKSLKLEELEKLRDGDIVTVYAKVILGKDNHGKVNFIYRKGNPRTAKFTISGTTLDNELGFNEIK